MDAPKCRRIPYVYGSLKQAALLTFASDDREAITDSIKEYTGIDLRNRQSTIKQICYILSKCLSKSYIHRLTIINNTS